MDIPKDTSSPDSPAIVLLGTLAVLLIGFASSALAQTQILIPQGMSQDAVNQMLIERVSSLTQRMDRIDNMLQYGMVGLAGNLIAHFFQLMKGRGR